MWQLDASARDPRAGELRACGGGASSGERGCRCTGCKVSRSLHWLARARAALHARVFAKGWVAGPFVLISEL